MRVAIRLSMDAFCKFSFLGKVVISVIAVNDRVFRCGIVGIGRLPLLPSRSYYYVVVAFVEALKNKIHRNVL